jgi:predicted O-linked N-acetylglucosamine transferase (SPINDLY family)
MQLFILWLTTIKQKTISRMKQSKKKIAQQVGLATDAYNAKDYASADKQLRAILAIDPNNADANYIHGMIAYLCKQNDAAIALIQRAIDSNANNAQFHNSLGAINKELGRLDDAEEHIRTAIKVAPEYGPAYNNLAALIQEIGNFDEAAALYLESNKRGDKRAFTHYLMLLNYIPSIKPEAVFEKHKNWEANYWGERPRTLFNHKQHKTNKKLRVAYISPDFRTHSVAYFFEPLLKAHDRNKIEVYCYYNNQFDDQTSERIRQNCDKWQTVYGQSDADIASLIHHDNIDILVDLAGHTGECTLGVLARKPAPIQVNWLGYPNSTGLTTIDYRFTDDIADPVGPADHLHSEQLIRLKNGFLCYQGTSDLAVSAPPCLQNKYITFGSFNNLSKVNSTVIKVWSAILAKVAGSKLLIKSRQLKFDYVKNNLLASFIKEGIDPARLQLQSQIKEKDGHLMLYSKVDIALDTFPYNGTTTTCEAMWMGVPTITLNGDRHSSRVGASLLTHSDQSELITDNENAYIDLATNLANEPRKLESLRKVSREKLLDSDLGNPRLFTQNIEDAYFDMLKKLK